MNIESQNIEFKESWHDEYQKWICGFANAQGGTLYIGLRYVTMARYAVCKMPRS